MPERVVWKIPLRPWSAFIDMPQGAQLLYAGVQGEPPTEQACVWALCDPEAPTVSRYVVAIPTGDALPKPATTYVGTFMLDRGALVFHVFDGGEGERRGPAASSESDS